MDPRIYTPGAGHVPPTLAGRDAAIHRWELMLNDVVAAGRVRSEDIILTGPRGVGKTVLLSAFADLARREGFEVLNLQAVRGSTSLLPPLIAQVVERSQASRTIWERAQRAMGRVSGIDVGVAGFSAGISTHEPTQPRPDTIEAGVLADAIAALANESRGHRPGAGGVLIAVDEMQVARAEDLAVLAATLHRLNVEYPNAAVIFAGTGLPHTYDVLVSAGVTHPDRLFTTQELPVSLSHDDAALALVSPARAAGVTWHPDAIDAVIRVTNGYPAHLQVVANAVWEVTPEPPTIGPDDAARGIAVAADRIATQSLGPHWRRLTDRQMEYLAAVALNGGRSTVQSIQDTLGREQKQSSRIRDALIHDGDIYAPRRGHVHLTVPLFAAYVLSEYEIARADSTDPSAMLSLEQMSDNLSHAAAGAIEHLEARELTLKPGRRNPDPPPARMTRSPER